MCGICGWVDGKDWDSSKSQAVLNGMIGQLVHRGPDDTGAAVGEGFALGMTRLSIIDVRTGHQPIWNEDKTCCIVFNGEIYNFQELRGQLERTGHRFRTKSDSEVILHAFEEWGSDCVPRLKGMFAFAVYDGRKVDRQRSPQGRLFLARDRVGKKPLYYYCAGGRFVFASEIKALLAHPKVPKRLYQEMLPLYLSYGYVPDPWTIFEDIRELSPGHFLTFEGGSLRTHPYWEIPSIRNDIAEKEALERLEQLICEATASRLISEVPLGAFLSGGLDSSAVVSVMAQLTSEPVETFAIGFSEQNSFNELKYAQLVARVFGTNHREFVVRPDAVGLLPKLVWHYDQPFADSSAIPTFLVSKLTRNHVTVALTGDGGDELFGGYDRFAAMKVAEVYRKVPEPVRKILEFCIEGLPESTEYRSIVRRMRRFTQSAVPDLAEGYLSLVGIFERDLIQKLVIPGDRMDPLEHFETYFRDLAGLDPVDQLLHVNMRSYLPGDLLVKVDRMSMANSLEARCPFLDHELVEFAFSLPAQLKIKGLKTKYILKKSLDGLLPTEIVKRKKHGFGVPVGHWFRSSLSDFVREQLLCSQASLHAYFCRDVIQRLVDEHQSGARDHGHKLWALLTFQTWHQIFIEESTKVTTAGPDLEMAQAHPSSASR